MGVWCSRVACPLNTSEDPPPAARALPSAQEVGSELSAAHVLPTGLQRLEDVGSGCQVAGKQASPFVCSHK